jgi:hypothetical protein
MTQANNTIVFNAAEMATLVADAIAGQSAFLKGKIALCAAFKDLTFDAFNGRAKMVQEALVSGGHSANLDSAVRMLNRMFDDSGVTKPKSTSADATKKAEQRKAVDAKVEKLIETAKPAELVKLAQKGDTVAAKAVAQIAEKAKASEKAKTAGMLKAIRTELAKADAVKLKQIAAILGIQA